jgi:hypothetical protein
LAATATTAGKKVGEPRKRAFRLAVLLVSLRMPFRSERTKVDKARISTKEDSLIALLAARTAIISVHEFVYHPCWAPAAAAQCRAERETAERVERRWASDLGRGPNGSPSLCLAAHPTDGVDNTLNWDSVGRPGLDPGTLGSDNLDI